MLKVQEREFWFVVGSQHLYGPETLNEVETNAKKIVEHLVGYKEDGSDVLGVYPLLPDGTCRFIVFDFDNHDMRVKTL